MSVIETEARPVPQHKHWQESTVEFRLDVGAADKGQFPRLRGVTVCAYGGTAEETIHQARAQLKLGPEWKVVEVKVHP